MEMIMLVWQMSEIVALAMEATVIAESASQAMYLIWLREFAGACFIFAHYAGAYCAKRRRAGTRKPKQMRR